MEDDLDPEVKQRISDAIDRANKALGEMSPQEKQKVEQKAFEIANMKGPYSLRKKLHEATERASEKLSAMSYEERREAGKKAYEKFTKRSEELNKD